MKNKSICIDARLINSSGIGTYLKELIINLKASNFKIFLIVTNKILKEEKELLKNFHLIILDAKIFSLKEIVLLPFKIPKCDLFFSPHFNVPIFKIRAKKRIVTIHDMYHLSIFSKLNFLEKSYAKFIINKAIKLSDKIVTVSNFSKNEILKYTKADKKNIYVIFNALNQNIFKKENDFNLLNKVKEKFNLPEKFFLFVGNLKAHKNLLNLLYAFEDFIKEDESFSLVIVGKNKDMINSLDIQSVIKNNKILASKVKLVDSAMQSDLVMMYELAKALIFPSFYEGFGFPPLEAMALSCPVIASRAASIPEICKDSVLYVDPYNYKTIVDAMKQIISDEKIKNDLIKKGKEILKLYSVENFIKNHLEVFDL